jgi:hypothetical protein
LSPWLVWRMTSVRCGAAFVVFGQFLNRGCFWLVQSPVLCPRWQRWYMSATLLFEKLEWRE